MSKFGNVKINQNQFPFILPALPYDSSHLEPYITAKTFSYHYNKHHQTYVTNLNKLIENTEFTQNSLEDIIIAASKDEEKKSIFNNAAQVWNHSFLWHSMQKDTDLANKKLMAQIQKDFGNLNNFKQDFIKSGASQFGSGWVWLVFSNDKLSIEKTANAELPMTKNQHAIITSDVWEHAYYLDYQNRRADYLQIFVDHLINWNFAEENFLKASS